MESILLSRLAPLLLIQNSFQAFPLSLGKSLLSMGLNVSQPPSTAKMVSILFFLGIGKLTYKVVLVSRKSNFAPVHFKVASMVVGHSKCPVEHPNAFHGGKLCCKSARVSKNLIHSPHCELMTVLMVLRKAIT